MASTDDPVVEQIRTILAEGEDIAKGWSDERVVEEASRRAGGTAAPAVGATARWVAMIAEIRSETDNDGQERRSATSKR